MDISSSRKERIKAIKETFHSLLWIATRQFSHRLQTFGLTYPQFMTLAALVAYKEPCSMRDLTSVTFQDPPTMTGIVDRLVKIKMVERTRSETDRRVVLVQATPASIELVNRISEEIMYEDLCHYTALADDDLATLEQLIRHLLRIHIEQYMSSPDMPLENSDLDIELEKLRRFIKNPIYYIKLEHQENR